jgi:16S rRNA (cytidine1402-2'-O)-methyltransferase
MKGGLKVALICDAGTPGISDPGHMLVSHCLLNSIVVETLPGPCSIPVALSSSGFPADKF